MAPSPAAVIPMTVAEATGLLLLPLVRELEFSLDPPDELSEFESPDELSDELPESEFESSDELPESEFESPDELPESEFESPDELPESEFEPSDEPPESEPAEESPDANAPECSEALYLPGLTAPGV